MRGVEEEAVMLDSARALERPEADSNEKGHLHFTLSLILTLLFLYINGPSKQNLWLTKVYGLLQVVNNIHAKFNLQKIHGHN